MRTVLKALALIFVVASLFAQFAFSAGAALPLVYLAAMCLLLLVPGDA